MSANALLVKLDGVRATGRGRWLARCPAHDDSTPSLSIRELDDGRVLVNDFGGCAAVDVLAAIGLDLADLFPQRAVDHRVRREHDPFHPRDVLFALADETQVAAIVAARVYYGYQVAQDEFDRMMKAIGRIAAAADLFKPHLAAGHRAVLSRAEVDDLAHA